MRPSLRPAILFTRAGARSIAQQRSCLAARAAWLAKSPAAQLHTSSSSLASSPQQQQQQQQQRGNAQSKQQQEGSRSGGTGNNSALSNLLGVVRSARQQQEGSTQQTGARSPRGSYASSSSQLEQLERRSALLSAADAAKRDTKDRELTLTACSSRSLAFVAGGAQPGIVRNLAGARARVISPRTLLPRAMLDPYPRQPDLARAYPLGPPRKMARQLDPFIFTGVDPLRAAPTNAFLRSDFCSPLGRILPRSKTGLQRKTQRRLGRAIRRARSMGIIPYFGRVA